MAPTTPTMTPFDSKTSRTLRSVAPMDSSIPRDRMRRCASTVKPPIDTRAMSSMPTVARASTMVDGLMPLVVIDPAGVMEEGRFLAAAGAFKRTVTSVGCATCPGGTRANSSSRLWGFCTMPTTVFPP